MQLINQSFFDGTGLTYGNINGTDRSSNVNRIKHEISMHGPVVAVMQVYAVCFFSYFKARNLKKTKRNNNRRAVHEHYVKMEGTRIRTYPTHRNNHYNFSRII